ncbi:putative glycosyltransferase EpsJ [[Clostridium] sordellii]|uniref:glycosyltransferase n=1 Tax=Paraclostridium sordellii TaxID=1505 RepID=UPI0005E28067|nr:glycosyltransferase [Paeniclostridium sordellii]CEN91457.1 putative glycosyltransferase EpsJ [[Clostridium] sordellii] [Paeniclostridium sordellii]
MTFTIIIPVYNVESYLEKCLESILKQKFNDYEIILVNDGSTDNSPQICDKYSSLYDNISVIHKSNEGLSQARNDAMKIANGEYFIFIDSDDWLVESSLEKVYEIIKNNDKPEIVINRILSYHQENDSYVECGYNFNIKKMANMTCDEILKECYEMPSFWAAAWIFVVKKSYIEEHDLYFTKGLLHEDEEWAPRLILNATKFGFNNECFYCNRVNRIGSITQSLNIKKEYDKLNIIDRLLEESQKDVYDENKKYILKSRCSSLYLGVLKNLLLYKNEEKSRYNKLIKELKNKKKTLLYSNKRVHKIIYLNCKFLGVILTSKFINASGGRRC